MDKLDEMRKQGVKLSQLPHEMAASLVQRWVASPQDRPRLQAWLSDFNTTPLSVEMPSSQKGILGQVRPPIPPIEGYTNPKDLRAAAQALQNKFKGAGIVK